MRQSGGMHRIPPERKDESLDAWKKAEQEHHHVVPEQEWDELKARTRADLERLGEIDADPDD